MPIVIAAALQQAEGGGNPMKTVGFLLVLLLGGAAFYFLLIAESKGALGGICAAFAFMILWVMAGLPLLPIHKVLFPSEGAFIVPFFALVHTRQQARQTLVAAAGMCILCAYMGAWLYIPTIFLALAISFWPHVKRLPALAQNYMRRQR